MKKCFNKYLLIIVLCLLTCILLPVVSAQEVIPSDTDVQFAKDFYKTFRNLVDSNKDLGNNEKEVDKENIKTIIPLLEKKLVYTEDAHEKLLKLKPSKTFVDCYTLVLNTTKKDVQIIKETIKKVKNNSSDTSFDSIETEFLTLDKRYEIGKNDFVAIVKSWKQKYVDEVEESYSN